MPVEINWGLANNGPNIGQSALSGFQTGLGLADLRQQRQQKAAVQGALSQYGTDPDAAISALIQAGAVNQAGALSTLRQTQQERAQDLATGKTIAGAYRPDGTVDTTKLQGAAAGAYGTLGAKAGAAISEHIATLTKEQRDAQGLKSAAVADASASLLALPAAARAQAYQTIYAPKLQAAGVDPQTITGAQQHLGDDNFLTAQAQSNSHAVDILKGISDDEKQAETVRHNKADEGVAGINARANVSRAGTAAFSAQTGRMSYEARKKGVGGFGTPGVAGGGAGTDDAPPD